MEFECLGFEEKRKIRMLAWESSEFKWATGMKEGIKWIKI